MRACSAPRARLCACVCFERVYRHSIVARAISLFSRPFGLKVGKGRRRRRRRRGKRKKRRANLTRVRHHSESGIGVVEKDLSSGKEEKGEARRWRRRRRKGTEMTGARGEERAAGQKVGGQEGGRGGRGGGGRRSRTLGGSSQSSGWVSTRPVIIGAYLHEHTSNVPN